MTDEQKRWVDQASYRQLLERWRYAPAGDPMFQGDTGDYYAKVMAEQKSLVGQEEHVSISKAIDCWHKEVAHSSPA